jgi:rubrerythrin
LKDNLTKEESEHNSKVSECSLKIENDEWDELFEILKDTNTGLKSWWD